MLEIETTQLHQKSVNKTITVDDVLKEAIKSAPPLDVKRGDLIRGETYYLTGGDPDKRNQI